MEDLFHLGIKGLIMNGAGDVLLLKANPKHLHDADPGRDYWDLPGGRLQIGETVEQTLAREIEEETGITTLSDIVPLGMILSPLRLHVGENTVGLVLAIYTCHIPKDASIQLSEEHIDHAWVPKKRAATLLHHKFSKEFCELLAQA